MRYTLRVPQDGDFLHKEFGISPAVSTLAPRSKAAVTVVHIEPVQFAAGVC